METATNAVIGDGLSQKNCPPCNNDVFITLIDKKSYIPLASCLVEYIINTEDLNVSEKLFYLLAEMHAALADAKFGERSAVWSGKIWAEKLNMSEEWIFAVQKNLEKKGFLKVVRDRDENNQNLVNKIFPTLPQTAFDALCKNYPSHYKSSKSPEPKAVAAENFNTYLNSTKLFIKFNLNQIENLVVNSTITKLQKLAWVYFYMRSYRSYVDCEVGEWCFPVTLKELANVLRCAESTASKILTNLEKNGFLKRSLVRAKPNNERNSARRKVVWYLEALVPQFQTRTLLKQLDRSHLQPVDDVAEELYSTVDKNHKKSSP